MSHVEERCDHPFPKRRDLGRLWVCTCEQVWVCRLFEDYRSRTHPEWVPYRRQQEKASHRKFGEPR